MHKNKVIFTITVMLTAIVLASCGIEKISSQKTKDMDFTVVSEIEMPDEVKQIVEERKEIPFKVAYSDHEYTYLIVGYGKQKYDGYSIQVKNVYETKNAIFVKTEFSGPKEYTNKEVDSYPYIVIKIEYTDKNVIFSE